MEFSTKVIEKMAEIGLALKKWTRKMSESCKLNR